MTHQAMIEYERLSRERIAARKAGRAGPRCKASGCTEPARGREHGGPPPAYCLEHAEMFRKRHAVLAKQRQRQARKAKAGNTEGSSEGC